MSSQEKLSSPNQRLRELRVDFSIATYLICLLLSGRVDVQRVTALTAAFSWNVACHRVNTVAISLNRAIYIGGDPYLCVVAFAAFALVREYHPTAQARILFCGNMHTQFTFPLKQW